jgi:hypothetical protein
MIVRRRLLSPRALLAEEPRVSVAVTVCWMLTLLATGAALVISLVCFLCSLGLELPPKSEVLFRALAGMLLMTAALTGVLCLGLTIVVYRVRRDPPPVPITVAAVFVSTLPIATMLLLAFRG